MDNTLAEEMLEALRLAGTQGLTGAALHLEKPSPKSAKGRAQKAPPRRAAIDALVASGRVLFEKRRYFLPAPKPTVEGVAGKLREIGPTEGQPTLWTGPELARKLTAAEQPLFEDAIELLLAAREVIALARPKASFFAFAEPLKAALSAESPAAETAPEPPAVNRDSVLTAYYKLVRESGGFPDIKISALQKALGPAAPGKLAGVLIDLWREGAANLSLGDWSLASEEMRAAAVELDGEQYLLVRIDDVA